MIFTHKTLPITLGLITILAAPSRADVVVVNADGSAAFTQIQPAINAANDGDIVLVKGGTYDGFTVVDKSVAVVSELDETVLIQTAVQIANLSAQRRVSLINLKVIVEAPLEDNGLLAVNNQGTIRALGCTFVGALELDIHISFVPYGAAGVKLVNCAKASFSGCVITGGEGSYTGLLYSQGGRGGDGVLSEDSNVAFFNCVISGADGGSGYSGGGAGGDALRLTGSSNFNSGNTLVSGGGGHGTDGLCCAWGGNAGDTIHFVDADSSVQLVETSLGLGVPGISISGHSPNGQPGLTVDGPGTQLNLPHLARQLVANSPIADQSILQLNFHGEPGDLTFLFIGTDFHLLFLTYGGFQLVLPNLVKFQGIVPASGVRTKNIPVNVLTPGMQSLRADLQSIHLDTSSTWVFGSAVELLILDPSL